MKKQLFILLVLIISSCIGQEKEPVQKLNFTEFKTAVIGKDVQLVDLRTPKEYEEGYIDDAINVDFLQKDSFETNILKFDKNLPIYIYCQAGGRSKRAAAQLKEIGFKEIYDFSGGYKQWSNKQD